MTYQPKNGKAPSDAAAERAWVEVMRIARANALIVDAYGGVATLATPAEQRKAGLRETVLRMDLFELEPTTEAGQTAGGESHGPNKAGAFDRAQKAIMVATGAFATRRG